MRCDKVNFDANYFLHGQETGVSLYSNYRWLPELTIPMAQAICNHLKIKAGESILDFGCARGYLVRALRQLGHTAFGIDCSSWAVKNADPLVCNYIRQDNTCECAYDWILAKDVLEHIPDLRIINNLLRFSRRGLFIVVPLADQDGKPYVCPEYENDITHIHRLSLGTWVRRLLDPAWAIEVSYRVEGIKDNWAHHPTGNGFLTARRLAA